MSISREKSESLGRSKTPVQTILVTSAGSEINRRLGICLRNAEKSCGTTPHYQQLRPPVSPRQQQFAILEIIMWIKDDSRNFLTTGNTNGETLYLGHKSARQPQLNISLPAENVFKGETPTGGNTRAFGNRCVICKPTCAGSAPVPSS
jgi:hypothetical protein